MASTAREQLVDFLAHLDLQTKGPKSWSLQDNNVEEHIQKTLENISEQLSHRYAVEHIRDRLWQEFRISYAYPENNFPALFLHGSYEMKSLDNATRVLVGNRAHEICLQQSFGNDRSRRSRSIVAETAQTTSSSRPRTSSHVSPLQSLKRKKKPRNSKQKRLRATEPARVKVGTCTKSNVRKQPIQTITTPSEARNEHGPAHRSYIDGDMKDIATPNRSSNGVSAQRLEQTPHNCIAPHDGLTHVRSQGTNTGSFGKILLAEDQRDMVIALCRYKSRCQEAEQKCFDLEQKLRHTTSIFAQTNGTSQDLMRQLSYQTEKMVKLKKKLREQDAMEFLEPYLVIGRAHDDASIVEQLIAVHADLIAKATDLLVLNASRQLSIEPLYGQSRDLDVLLRTTFDTSIESKGERRSEVVLALGELIQALTGAAIKVWVIESTFNSTSTMSTPLLQKYRGIIATLCGREGLFNLDIAAHQALISQNDFKQDVITPMASQLTKRLVDTLRLLIDQKYLHDTFKELEPRLGSIMRLAVHFRSLLLVSSKTFETIWPQPGVSFDEDEMLTEPSMNHAKGLCTVKFPFLPGFRAYKVEKAMVTYQGFGHGVPKSVAPDSTIKALVFV